MITDNYPPHIDITLSAEEVETIITKALRAKGIVLPEKVTLKFPLDVTSWGGRTPSGRIKVSFELGRYYTEKEEL